jgi:ATP-dependent exoDNAse (exonuclease V) beta subunit
VKEFIPTDAQGKAIVAPRHAAVVAAAGSGKTGVLVERFLHLLFEEESRRPGDLLAITFTNRAAAEMRRRLRLRLTEIARSEDHPDREQAAACLEEFHRAAVMTIHAFATQVLRRHPFEAGLDPTFAVAEEIAVHHAQRDTVDTLLQDILSQPDNHALRGPAATALRTWGHRATGEAFLGLLRRERIGIERWDELAALSSEQVLERSRRLWSQRMESLIDQAMRGERLVLWREMAETVETGFSGDAERSVATVPEVVKALADPNATAESRSAALTQCFPVFLTAGEARKGPHHTAHGKKADWSPEAWAALRRLIPALGEALAPIQESHVPWVEAHEEIAADLTLAVARLLQVTSRQLIERKDSDGWIDFGDQLREAARVVSDEGLAVAEVLADRFHAALIDEFQDTDPAQWRLIEGLLRAAGERRFPVMLVGDPLQSIYRFRGAEVGLFAEAQRDLESRVSGDDFQPIPMHENFRSVPAVVDAVCGIFDPLLPRITEGTRAPMDGPRMISRSTDPAWPAGVHLLAVDRDGESDDALRAEAFAVARAIRTLTTDPAGWARTVWGEEPPEDFTPRRGNIAILLRATTHLAAFEHALRMEGVPFNVGGGAGLAQRQEIWDLSHLMRFLAEPEDSHALLGLLRTPWMGWSDDLLLRVTHLTCGLETESPMTLWDRVRKVKRTERDGLALSDEDQERITLARETLNRALAQRHHASPAELADDVLTRTGAWGLVRMEPEGSRRLANLRRGVERLRRSGARGMDALLATAEEMERLIMRGGRESEEQLTIAGQDAVTLMTIHAAKGLEFPVVVLPQLHARHQGHERRGHWLWDDALGLGVRAPNPDEQWRPTPNAAMQMALRDLEREGEAEEARLLYVAMTRAERLLILSGTMRVDPKAGLRSVNRQSNLAWILDGLGLTGAERIPESPICPPWPEAAPIPVITPSAFAAETEIDPRMGEPCLAVTPDVRSAIADLGTAPNLDRAVAITALETFARCPNQHFLEQEAGNPQAHWFDADDVERGGPDPREVGTLFHRYAECHARGESIDEAKLQRGLERDVVAKAQGLWRRFQGMEIFREIEGFDEHHAEHAISIVFPEGPLRGKIDLLAHVNEEWEVIDHKTGSQDRPDEELAEHHRIQMLCYLLFLRGHAPEQGQYRARLVYPALGREVVLIRSADELDEAESEINDLVERYKRQRGQLQAVYPNAACAACRFASLPICRRLSRSP